MIVLLGVLDFCCITSTILKNTPHIFDHKPVLLIHWSKALKSSLVLIANLLLQFLGQLLPLIIVTKILMNRYRWSQTVFHYQIRNLCFLRSLENILRRLQSVTHAWLKMNYQRQPLSGPVLVINSLLAKDYLIWRSIYQTASQQVLTIKRCHLLTTGHCVTRGTIFH